ncbi:MarR family transcriptional regulator [uncultured Nostoc sp.]|uniref:MarR family transcriptional regulator n=1 Tax=uncultured Nostoc sp. TaxID=340711 RepID=UPI0035CBEE0B
MTQPNSKIQGRFYPLKHEEWLKACRELTPAQRDVLYYIRTIDPYNQGIDINAAEVARQLSAPERIVHRQTVSRALKELDAKGFIDLELLQVRTKVKPKGLWCNNTPEFLEDTDGVMMHPRCDDAPMVCEDTDGVMTHPRCDDAPSAIATHHSGSPRTTMDHDAPCAIATHHAEAESLVEREIQNPKINKNYLDFIKTLSEDEGANFLEFCEEKTKNLSQPVNDIEAWLAHKNKAGRNRWEVYYEKYLASKQVQAKKTETKNARDEFRRELEERQRQAQRAWEESQRQNLAENTGGDT